MYHLAQLNIGKIKYPLHDPRMAEFIENLDRINTLAEASPGFVWRLQDDSGNATSISAYDDPMIIVNMSVWENIEVFKAFVYRSDHSEFLRRRHEWFERIMSYIVMWWIPAGHIPTVAEAKERLAHLETTTPMPKEPQNMLRPESFRAQHVTWISGNYLANNKTSAR